MLRYELLVQNQFRTIVHDRILVNPWTGDHSAKLE